MAKKKATKVVEPQIEETFEETFEETIVEEPKARERVKPSNEWEIKDRIYYLTGNKKPLSRSIKSTNIFGLTKKKVMKEN